jgi:hypothetical protein
MGKTKHWMLEGEVKVTVPGNRLESPEGGWGIAVHPLDLGARRGWVVSTTPPVTLPRKDPVPILQEAGWAPGPVWIRFPGRPARSQSLYLLSYFGSLEGRVLRKKVSFRNIRFREMKKIECLKTSQYNSFTSCCVFSRLNMGRAIKVMWSK